MSEQSPVGIPRLKLKTYSHLMEQKRIPTDYEIVTSKLHYYVEKGFEVNLPMGEWYKQYRDNSLFKCNDWELFSDPRQSIYSTYVDLQKTKEIFVDKLFQSMDEQNYDHELHQPWLETLVKILPVLRFKLHGFSMIAAYIAQMAPSGRITITAMLQAADETRRVERISYRMCQLQQTNKQFGQNAKDLWQNDPLWQPMRRLVEKLLVTYDWGESFVALNLCVKPLIDEFFFVYFGKFAKKQGDPLLQELFFSLNEDCQWHCQWSKELVTTVFKQNSDVVLVVKTWIQKWLPLTHEALAGFYNLFEDQAEIIAKELSINHFNYLEEIGVKVSDEKV